MITQQHEHEIQQKTQAPSPVKQHRWRDVLLSILGVALPLVAGWWMAWPLAVVDIFPTDKTLSLLLHGVVLVVVPVAVGVFLLCFAFRARWAAVFAGIAWFIGQILASVVHSLVLGGWPALPAYQAGFWAGEVVLILLVLAPLLFGMALGAGGWLALGKWRASRQHNRS